MPEPRQEDQSDYYITGVGGEMEEEKQQSKGKGVNNCTCQSAELNNVLYYVIF